MQDFTPSNDLLTQPDALRDRARRDGYLFFRGLLDPAPLWNVRRQILAIVGEAGWLKPGTDTSDGIAAPGVCHVEGEPVFNDLYYKTVMKLEDFHALAHDTALIRMLDILFGEPTLVHPRNIARIIFPQAALFTTPAHQDYIHIRGTEETWTAWIPLADCPQGQGSLAVMPGSHKTGLYPVHAAYGAGGVGIDTDALAFPWAASDFQAGDVVLFHSMTIHKGLPNLSPDRMRISVDFRYQGVSQPVVMGSLLPHGAQIGWPDVYEGWKSAEHQLYWEKMPLNIVG